MTAACFCQLNIYQLVINLVIFTKRFVRVNNDLYCIRLNKSKDCPHLFCKISLTDGFP